MKDLVIMGVVIAGVLLPATMPVCADQVGDGRVGVVGAGLRGVPVDADASGMYGGERCQRSVRRR